MRASSLKAITLARRLLQPPDIGTEIAGIAYHCA